MWKFLKNEFERGKRESLHQDERRAAALAVWVEAREAAREYRELAEAAKATGHPPESVAALSDAAASFEKSASEALVTVQLANGERDRWHTDNRARVATTVSLLALVLSVVSLVTR